MRSSVGIALETTASPGQIAQIGTLAALLRVSIRGSVVVGSGAVVGIVLARAPVSHVESGVNVAQTLANRGPTGSPGAAPGRHRDRSGWLGSRRIGSDRLGRAARWVGGVGGRFDRFGGRSRLGANADAQPRTPIREKCEKWCAVKIGPGAKP